MQEASSQAGTKRSTERKKEDTFGNVHAATLTELENTGKIVISQRGISNAFLLSNRGNRVV